MKRTIAGYHAIGVAALSMATLFPTSVAQAVPTPLHAYDFNGNLDDSGTANVPITSEGGTLGTGYYEFDPQLPAPADEGSLYGAHNQGLTLTNPGLSDPGIYSIEMYVRYDTINNISASFPDWLKLIDFKNGTESLGVYYVDSFRSPNGTGVADESSVYRFTYAPGGPPQFEDSQPVMTPGVWVHTVLTRDALGESVAYVNGEFAFSIDDSLEHGVFDGPDNVMRFFQGDLPAINGAYYEVGKGAVDFLNIYDEVLSASDVATLAAAVPEPSTLLLFAGAVACCLPRLRNRPTARR